MIRVYRYYGGGKPRVVRIPHVYLIPWSGGDGNGRESCRGGHGGVGAIVPSRCAREAIVAVVNVDVIFGIEEYCSALTRLESQSYIDPRNVIHAPNMCI